jgi:hypothetical protein
VDVGPFVDDRTARDSPDAISATLEAIDVATSPREIPGPAIAIDRITVAGEAIGLAHRGVIVNLDQDIPAQIDV